MIYTLKRMTGYTLLAAFTLFAMIVGANVADASIGSGPRVEIYTGSYFTGHADFVETSTDNRGWCVKVGDVKSLRNRSAHRVAVYRTGWCTDRVKTLSPWSSVNVAARSIRIGV